VKYKDIATFPDSVDLEMQADAAQLRRAESDEAKRRLKLLYQQRLERVIRAAHHELRRYLDVEQLARLELENRIEK
jgi:hypothetical protein